MHTKVGVDPGLGQQLVGAGTANAVDVGKCDLDALLAREINTNKACHVLASLSVVHGGVGVMRTRWEPRLRPSAPEVVSVCET